MTLYLALRGARDGRRISLDTRITVSQIRRRPSRRRSSACKPGQTITRQATPILALVTRSANDMATALAEHLGGTESAFAAQMTARARSLGMRNTTFRNANGLPEHRPGDHGARHVAARPRAAATASRSYFRYF